MKELITIQEKTSEELEVREFAAQVDGFEFWLDVREDIYQDWLQ